MFASVYFYDTKENHELENRMAFGYMPDTKIGRTVIKNLQNIIHDLNPFYKDFKSAIERTQNEKIPGLQIVFKAEIKPDEQHKGCYNAPSSVSQVAAIIPGYDKEKHGRDIILYCKSKTNSDDFAKDKNGQKRQKLISISQSHPIYDPVHYVTMYPYGTLGWGIDSVFTNKGYEDYISNKGHCDNDNDENEHNDSTELLNELKDYVYQSDNETSNLNISNNEKRKHHKIKPNKTFKQLKKRKRGTYVNCRKYYKYRAMVRGTSQQDNSLHRFGSLWQQKLVDDWAKIEANDLNYIDMNQDTLRASYIDGLEEAISNDSIDTEGKRCILPQSHTGSL